MTRNFDDFFKQYQEEVDPLQAQLDQLTKPADLKPVAASPAQAVLQGVEQAGGALLTNTVKGISVIGQSIMGALEFLENNQGMYDRLVTEDKSKGFTWDNAWESLNQTGSVIHGAVNAGASQGQRILQSKNLTELGQNSYSGVDLLKNLPGKGGDFFRNQDSTAAKVATSIAGLGLEILLDRKSVV